jgi:hypothetical protein
MMTKIVKNQNGGVLLITLVIISGMIVTLMAIATLRLAELAKHAHRVNESFKYINIMEDMAQVIGRAGTLGAAVDNPLTAVTCPQLSAGSAPVTIGGKTFCLPGGSVAGVCYDEDQNAGTTHDRYCLSSLALITSNEDFEIDPLELVAKNDHFIDKFIFALADLLQIKDAHAAGCGSPDWSGPCFPTGGSTAATAPTPSQNLTAPTAYTAAPGGAATQQTDGTSEVTRNNMEPWSPTGLTWAHVNEVLTPTCTVANQYWLGCMRCTDANITCVQLTMCPASEPGCALARRYRQTIAIY